MGSGAELSAGAAAPPASAGVIARARGTAGLAPADAPTKPDRDANVSAVAVAENHEAPALCWGDVLEGALHPDWDAVDGELRQFLSRLRRLAETPDGYGMGASWAVWIGAASAMILASRAARGPQRLFRRRAPAVVWALPRDPAPVSPWPMGAP
jgi:hypothetical protein